MKFLPILLVFALATTTAFAADPGPRQDFCIGVNNTVDGVFVNGKFCKDPNLVTADDFIFTGFRTPGNTSNPLGSKVTPSFVDQFLGEKTLGISKGRIDFAPGGLNPPHTHPRASEIFHVIEGTLYAGFVTSNQNGNRLFTKILYPGDLMVFPIGIIHFQLNIGKTKALAFASFDSQNPGIMTIANSVFGAQPPISVDVLTKAFQVDKKEEAIDLSSKLNCQGQASRFHPLPPLLSIPEEEFSLSFGGINIRQQTQEHAQPSLSFDDSDISC